MKTRLVFLAAAAVVAPFFVYWSVLQKKDAPSEDATSLFLEVNIDFPSEVPPETVAFNLETTNVENEAKLEKKNNEVADYVVEHLNLGSNSAHAIIVPYRDRPEQLEQFLKHMETFLKQFEDRFHVYIIEQDDQDCFNRGFLFNAGFLEASKREEELGCVVLHDIDRLPLGEVDYTRCSIPVRLAHELEEHQWKPYFAAYCGGVVIAAPDHVREFNGMSNDYRGWGKEDDDLCLRIKHVTPVATPPPGHGKYTHLQSHHTRRVKCGKDENVWVNEQLKKEMMNGSDRWKRDGLNSIKYRVTKTSTLVKDFAFLYKVVSLSDSESPTTKTA